MGESIGNIANNAKVISNNLCAINSLSIIKGASTFVANANTIITVKKIVYGLRSVDCALTFTCSGNSR